MFLLVLITYEEKSLTHFLLLRRPYVKVKALCREREKETKSFYISVPYVKKKKKKKKKNNNNNNNKKRKKERKNAL